MRNFIVSLKQTFKRNAPLLIAGATALVASDGFRNFVENHPAVAVYVPVVVWVLHAVGHSRSV